MLAISSGRDPFERLKIYRLAIIYSKLFHWNCSAELSQGTSQVGPGIGVHSSRYRWALAGLVSPQSLAKES